MDAYCTRQGLSNNQCRFIFDGERIKDDDTPESLEMENGDEVGKILLYWNRVNNFFYFRCYG